MTTHQIAAEAYGAITVRMQSDAFAAEERRRAQQPPTIAEIVHNWEIERCEWRCFDMADGTPLQRAARLTDPFNRTSQFIVMQNVQTGDYTVQCPSRRHHWGPIVIAAMREVVACGKQRGY